MKQTGAALIVSLVLLVLVTLLGVAGIQNVALEEKMAGNAYDRNIAFQVAEAALRYGESIAEAQAKAIPPNSGFPSYTDADDTCPAGAVNNCASGLCPTPDKDCPKRWEASSGFSGWVDASGLTLGALAGNAPQYFVEYLGGTFPCAGTERCEGNLASGVCDCKRYRITARSNPGTGRATVILQSVYATD